MTDDDASVRPNPDALLAEARREERGRLKVFLGAAPGVGKTFAMLRAAHQRRREGVDVVAAVVETHGRRETDEMVRGLETLARRSVRHRDRAFEEMDLDALLARRPALALVDELAHTNVPGSRHAKRWQDVEEVLAAGIDVYTTLNVQHLESLNDVVERITGVRVRETLPDRVLQSADEIELVDLAPAELLQRLAAGKVYVPDQARRAAGSFFRPGNLTALREMALRQTADRVDQQMISWMRANAVAGPWPTRERILVLVGPDGAAETLVRAAKRTADRRGAPWMAVHVETARHFSLPEDARERLDAALRLAEELGGATRVLRGDDITGEVLACAREENVTVLVVGRSRTGASPAARLGLARALTDDLIRRARGFDVLVVGDEERKADRPGLRARILGGMPAGWRPWAEAVAATVLATALAVLLDPFLDVPNLSLVYLTAVLVVASRHGLWPSIAASGTSFVAYNFFFTDPLFTLHMNRREDVLSLAFFLLVSVVVSNLAARLKMQVEATKRSVRRTTNLFDFSRRVAGAATLDDVLWAVVSHVAATLQGKAVALLPGADGRPEIRAGHPPEDALDPGSDAAADWAWRHGVRTGRGSDTLPTSPWLFLPLRTGRGPVGVLGVQMPDRDGVLSPEQVRLVDALADQAAVAIERAQLVRDLEGARVAAETERLRAALLTSISHDLRTPLVSILGSSTSLVDRGDALDGSRRLDLARTIRDEAERLDRFVQNLLDMTRIGAGALVPRRDWVDLRDVVAAAADQAKGPLRRHPLEIDLPDDLPLLHADAALMQQVVFNLLDNAAKHSPPDAPVRVWARVRGDVLAAEVCDRGPGIPPEDRERVFDMFYRVRAEDSRTAGTGLGLAICRGIVEAHGGTIRAEAGLHGAGTCIVVSMPLAEPPAAPAGEG